MTPEIKRLVDGLKEQLQAAEQTADFIIITKRYIERLETAEDWITDECPYCGEEVAQILCCQGCAREGCVQCMPAEVLCPPCEEDE